MKKKNKKNKIKNIIKSKFREEFISAGGLDGRYREKTVKSKKKYKRTRDKKVKIDQD